MEAIREAPVSAFVLSFFVLSFAGWLWESTVCALAHRGSFANSGFLLGPICPIYGVGSLACWLLLRNIEGNLALFLASAVLCCSIEYAVGVVLERATHARFWDYSGFPLNINGRVCLYGALLFGAASWLICRLIEPALLSGLSSLPTGAIRVLAVVLTGIAICDAAASLASWRRLSASLERLRTDVAERIDAELQEVSHGIIGRIPDSVRDRAATASVRGRAVNGWLLTLTDAVMDALRERISLPAFVADGTFGLRTAAKKLTGNAQSVPATSAVPKLSLNKRELRFFNAFTHLKMLPYEGVIRLTGLKDRALELFGRR
ncbi:putative ABC transporter permease [Collinsella sp. AGMB00827]|uniref:ABC transporter permease n=2 Tax=Collinsella ureilytica TaxID=2869515 RepID=A0ABS7MLH0_9ACTN|nr:putative ABC transporter permease [Collinsella urealyticum]